MRLLEVAPTRDRPLFERAVLPKMQIHSFVFHITLKRENLCLLTIA